MKCSHRNMERNFHKNHYYDHPAMEKAQVCIKRQITKETMVRVYNEILFTNKKELLNT